jgi:hypothetical protein
LVLKLEILEGMDMETSWIRSKLAKSKITKAVLFNWTYSNQLSSTKSGASVSVNR